jgi:hypothetical protein
VLDGLKSYFDKCLGNVLLYRFERSQYVEIKERFPELASSDIYGSEHLLRLFGNNLACLTRASTTSYPDCPYLNGHGDNQYSQGSLCPVAKVFVGARG